MNFLEVGDKIKCVNGDEVKLYKVIERNNDVDNPPEYVLENLETGKRHGPVFWEWLKDAELTYE